MTDYYYMDCEECREALSARLDDEESSADALRSPDFHLEFCGACASWYEDAAMITRRARTSAVVAWPDVADAVLAKVPPGAAAGTARLRLSLGVVGVLQGGFALLTMVLDGPSEQTAGWPLALGAVFAAIAVRPVRRTGAALLVGVVLGVQRWEQLPELLTGRSSPGGALEIALTVIGLTLVVVLGRRMPSSPRGPNPPVNAAGRFHRPARPTGKWGAGPHTTIHRVNFTRVA